MSRGQYRSHDLVCADAGARTAPRGAFVLTPVRLIGQPRLSCFADSAFVYMGNLTPSRIARVTTVLHPRPIRAANTYTQPTRLPPPEQTVFGGRLELLQRCSPRTYVGCGCGRPLLNKNCTSVPVMYQGERGRVRDMRIAERRGSWASWRPRFGGGACVVLGESCSSPKNIHPFVFSFWKVSPVVRRRGER